MNIRQQFHFRIFKKLNLLTLWKYVTFFSLNGRILSSLNVENMKLGPNISPENSATTSQSTSNETPT